MTGQRPSPKLLALLAVVVAMAAWVYGAPLLHGDDGATVDADVPVSDLGFATEEDPVPVQPWSPPENPRDPFAVPPAFTAADADDTDDGSAAADAADGDTGLTVEGLGDALQAAAAR